MTPFLNATHLEYRQQEVLFARFILVAKQRKHDRLKQSVNLGHRDQACQRGNDLGDRLKNEKEVAIVLTPAIFRDGAHLQVSVAINMARKFL